MIDYSRFDHIDSDAENEEISNNREENIEMQSRPTALIKKSSSRFQYQYEGKTIYEWEQSIDEVNIFIATPFGITRQILEIKIFPQHLVSNLMLPLI